MFSSHWYRHADGSGSSEAPVEARRCTVQLSTGRLYLDAAATPVTALLGHDLPPTQTVDSTAVQALLFSLDPAYVCIALCPSYAAAAELALALARQTAGYKHRVIELNSIAHQPQSTRVSNECIVAYENETLARTGRWLASAGWPHPPDFIVVGDALALGSPFGAVLARDTLAQTLSATPDLSTKLSAGNSGELVSAATFDRVAAVIRAVESQQLIPHGRELADYLHARLIAVHDSCPQLEDITSIGLFFRIKVASSLTAPLIRRRMCERGVLVAVDEQNRLVINPPLALRIAEADVITGALRGALLDSPMPSAPACCPSCASTGGVH